MSCRNYTNPYLYVNPSTIKGMMQVLTILGILGIWYCSKNCYIWKKNGGMHTLVQYPGTIIVCYTYYVLLILLNCSYLIATAVAKEALEVHYICDGGYCKFHLSYSRHTDLNVKA
ncbi:hypothetical protein GIB67_021263 [Kingdonia uniflora]|uniref:Uncharacterized protein n=1 Tax=Kingdonia uniflora TaxID=39325 RepID=A0A7J7LFN9_9MAGN|nr:hypothetical protein GIB67_021263 [Kingdonia uniflora]